jgi:IMP cyclohydrolase
MILWIMLMKDIGHKDFQHLVNRNILVIELERFCPFCFLETRQLNRRHYESYVCRRIIGKQAVVVLGCDNRHMDQLMSKNSDSRNFAVMTLVVDF